jgi:hypothetical protein
MARIMIAATVSLLVTVSQVQAANDWNVPCFSGNCEFDVARSDATIPATMKVVRTHPLSFGRERCF